MVKINTMEKVSIIRVRCKKDGTILRLKEVAGMEKAMLTCPTCGVRRPFTEYERIGEKSDNTIYAEQSGPKNGGQYQSDDTTTNIGKQGVNAAKKNADIGYLRVMPDGEEFRLKMGRNVIGRKSEYSSADIQISCVNKRMSKEHIVIDVKKVAGVGLVYHLRLYKEKVNATFLNNVKIEPADTLVLSDKDVIKLPDVNVSFVIPREDETEIEE